MPRYQESIYQMGKAGTRSRLRRLKNEAIARTMREMILPMVQPTKPTDAK